MEPVRGSVELDLSADVLWDVFRRPDRWPWWNACMAWVGTRELSQGGRLVWLFEPLRWWYPYLMPAVATLVEVDEGRQVTWEVTAFPGFRARHSYTIEPLGPGRSRFSSWEQAAGPAFRAAEAFWLAHFTFVRNASLQGARLLAARFRQEGRLDPATLPRRRRMPLAGARDVLGAADVLRLRYQELAPGVWAVIGGGGNSLVVESLGEVLIVDPKTPPFSRLLSRWIDRELGGRCSTVIDTHHHYDHTFGNPEYDEAAIVAHTSVPHLMLRRDGGFWRRHPAGMPQPENLVVGTDHLRVGDQDVTVHHLGRAHTVGDLAVHLRRNGQDIVATGDVGCPDHYPFLDTGEGGADLPGWAAAAEALAERYPDAVFVPGHGAVGSARELRRGADYLRFLRDSVIGSVHDGLDEDGAVRNVDVSSWRLAMLPVMRYGTAFTTSGSNVRRAFRLLSGTGREGASRSSG
ncbi:MBL fold metallo-hydrolase [Kitasatospora sp. NPDC001660]